MRQLVDHQGHRGLRTAVEAGHERLRRVAVGPLDGDGVGRLRGQRGDRGGVLAAPGSLGGGEGLRPLAEQGDLRRVDAAGRGALVGEGRLVDRVAALEEVLDHGGPGGEPDIAHEAVVERRAHAERPGGLPAR